MENGRELLDRREDCGNAGRDRILCQAPRGAKRFVEIASSVPISDNFSFEGGVI